MVNRRHVTLVGFALVLGAVSGTATARLLSASPRGQSQPSAPRVAPSKLTEPLATSTLHATSVPKPVGLQWLDTADLGAAISAIRTQTGSSVGVVVRPFSGAATFVTGNLLTGAAWSTIKVPIVVARYELAVEQGQATSQSLNALAQAAITESDNAAAAALFDQIAAANGGVVGGSRYVQRELAAAGDTHTVVNTLKSDPPWSTYGQTMWSLVGGTLFYRELALRCVPPRAETNVVLGLMREITSSQRWGAGAAAWDAGTTVAFKGGWGPDTSGRYLVRQFAIIQGAGGRGFVVGLLAKAGDGTFASGTQVLSQLAAAVARAAHPARSPIGRTCA